MRLRHVARFFKIDCVFLLFVIAVCRQPVVAGPVPPYSYQLQPENILRAHGVALTQRAVAAALKSKSSEVRNAAADLLTERWPKAAHTPIEQALANEPNASTRVWMASDLLRIGDAAGRRALVKQCHDPAEWGSTRMSAAAQLTREFGDDSCIDSILQVLHSATDPKGDDGKAQALELVPILIGRVDQTEAQTMFEVLIASLQDPAPYVRITASQTLKSLGDVHAFPSLQSAIGSDSFGRKTLVSLCHNAAELGSVRMDAATHLSQNFGDDSCLDSVVEVLQSATDPKDDRAKAQAMEIARMVIHRVDRTQSQRLFELLTASLRDPVPFVRVVAAVELQHLGDARAIPSLQAAVTSETDKNCRRMISASLEVLQNRTQTQ